jgi:hypothetical protein
LLRRQKFCDFGEGLFKKISHDTTIDDLTPSEPPNDIKLSGERKRVRLSAVLDAGLWNAEVLADFGGEKLVELAMPGNGRHLALGSIDVHGMRTAFSKELTAVTLEMTNEVGALHAESLKGSRMTEAFASACSLRARLASRTSVTASCRFARASSSVAPCEFAPGSSSIKAMKPSGTC